MAELKIDDQGSEYIQFNDEKEMAASLGIDLDANEGYCTQRHHHMNKYWEKIEIDRIF